MTIGNRVIHLVKEKGLEQKDLADYLQTSPSTVSGWKGSKNPSSVFIIPICEFLGVSANYLLTGEDAPTANAVDPLEQELISLIHNLPRGGKERVKIFITGLNEGLSVAADERKEVQKMAK